MVVSARQAMAQASSNGKVKPPRLLDLWKALLRGCGYLLAHWLDTASLIRHPIRLTHRAGVGNVQPQARSMGVPNVQVPI